MLPKVLIITWLISLLNFFYLQTLASRCSWVVLPFGSRSLNLGLSFRWIDFEFLAHWEAKCCVRFVLLRLIRWWLLSFRLLSFRFAPNGSVQLWMTLILPAWVDRRRWSHFWPGRARWASFRIRGKLPSSGCWTAVGWVPRRTWASSSWPAPTWSPWRVVGPSSPRPFLPSRLA